MPMGWGGGACPVAFVAALLPKALVEEVQALTFVQL